MQIFHASNSPMAALTIVLAVIGLILAACEARPQEIRAMTSGGFAATYNAVVPDYESATGETVLTAYGASMGGAPDSIPMRLERGEATDVVILAAAGLEGLIAEGHVVASSRVDLARSRIGVAVRAGAPHPDISTVEALKQTLLAAASIAYSASASGTYLSNELFVSLGIADQIRDKAQRVTSERVGDVVARGDAELGFQQISELLPINGIDYVGPLPDEAQRVTVFSAGITTNAANPEGARALLEFLSSPAVVPTMIENGLEPAGQQ